MSEGPGQLDQAIQCPSCGARLQLVADCHDLTRPSLFAVYCPGCGKRVPLPEPVGLVHSLKLVG